MRLTISAILFGLILSLAGAAQAHRVAVYAYVEDGHIKGEGYVSGGGKVSNQQVKMLDAGGKVLAETKTNQDGAFSLPLPQAKPPLTLVLNAGAGHRATFELGAADLGVAAPASPAATAPVAAKPADQAVAVRQDLGPQVKKAVEQAVAPLRAQLAEMALRSNEVSLRDIIGGLGWIVGLLGLAAYMKARKMAGAPK